MLVVVRWCYHPFRLQSWRIEARGGWKGGWILVEAGAFVTGCARVSQINEHVLFFNLHFTDRVDYLPDTG